MTNVSLTNYTVDSKQELTSPRSLICCRRLNIRPPEITNPNIDIQLRQQQLAQLKIEFGYIRQSGISQEEYQQIGAPIEAKKYVNIQIQEGRNEEIIEKILEKQRHEAQMVQERFEKQTRFAMEVEQKRKQQEIQQMEKDQKRLEHQREMQNQIATRLQEKQQKNKIMQESAQATVEARHREMVERMEQLAIKQNQNLENLKTTKLDKLHQKASQHGQRMERSTRYFQSVLETRNGKNMQMLEITQQRLENQKQVNEETLENRKIRSQSKLKQIKQNVDQYHTQQFIKKQEFFHQLTDTLNKKENLRNQNLNETVSKYNKKSENYEQQIHKMEDFYNQKIQHKQDKLNQKFGREEKNMQRSLEQSMNLENLQKTKQKIEIQQQKLSELQELQEYNQNLRKCQQDIKQNKAEKFMQERENLKNMVLTITVQNQALKQQAEFEKFYGLNAWKWKAGIIDESLKSPQLQSKSPTRIQSRLSPRRAPDEGRMIIGGISPTPFMKQKQGISQLNKAMETEERREVQRQQELRNARSDEERRDIVARHKDERILTAKKLEEMRQQMAQVVYMM